MSTTSQNNIPGRRSNCPVNLCLEIFGDKWSLLIVRDCGLMDKKTFGDFLAADEHIARNILADRLVKLEKEGILHKAPHSADGRKDIYELTSKGQSLLPILQAMATWGNQHEPRTATLPENIDLIRSPE